MLEFGLPACTAGTTSHMDRWHNLRYKQVAQPQTCHLLQKGRQGGGGGGKRDTMPLGVMTGASVPRSSPSRLLQNSCTDFTYSLDKLATALLVAQCWLPHTNSSQDTRTATPASLHCCCRTLAKICHKSLGYCVSADQLGVCTARIAHEQCTCITEWATTLGIRLLYSVAPMQLSAVTQRGACKTSSLQIAVHLQPCPVIAHPPQMCTCAVQ